MLFEKKDAAKFYKYSLPHPKTKFGFFSGLLLALLPKCPLCFMAFSGTMLLCDQAGSMSEISAHSSLILFSLSAFFCGITFAGILFNYHGNRTAYALLMALAGTVCILFSIVFGGSFPLYYSGVAFMFCGVCLNSRVHFLIIKIVSYLSGSIRNQIVEI